MHLPRHRNRVEGAGGRLLALDLDVGMAACAPPLQQLRKDVGAALDPPAFQEELVLGVVPNRIQIISCPNGLRHMVRIR